MKRQIVCSITGFLLFAMIIWPTNSLAAPYYEGKIIKFIVGFYPGGGNDRVARVLAKHLPKYIPGKPRIFVENMPGADSVIAANYLYNVAKPDGLAIATLGRALVFSQLLGVEGIKFDMTKFSWIGSPGVEAFVFVIRSNLPYKNMDDLRKANKTIFVSGVGPPSIASQFAHITKEFLVPNIKVVEYRSGAESWLAMERKEIDGLGDAFNNIKIRLERGEIRPLFRTRISQPGIENLPVNEDLTSDPTGKKIMAMHSIIGGSGRSCVFPPGTPANIVAILRNAFEKAIDDPELKEEAKKLQMDMEYVSAEKCLDIQKYVLSQPTEVVKEFSKFIKF